MESIVSLPEKEISSEEPGIEPMMTNVYDMPWTSVERLILLIKKLLKMSEGILMGRKMPGGQRFFNNASLRGGVSGRPAVPRPEPGRPDVVGELRGLAEKHHPLSDMDRCFAFQ